MYLATFAIYQAAAQFAIAFVYVLAAEFLYYMFYGTKYDTVPFFFRWLGIGTNYIITPLYTGAELEAINGNNVAFTQEQISYIWNLLLFEWIVLYLIYNPPTTSSSAVMSSANLGDKIFTSPSTSSTTDANMTNTQSGKAKSNVDESSNQKVSPSSDVASSSSPSSAQPQASHVDILVTP